LSKTALDKHPPTGYKPAMDQDKFNAILVDIASGEAAYKAIEANGLTRKAFYHLIATDETAGNKYARAKQAGMERWADDIVELADEERIVTKTVTRKDGSVEVIEMDIVDRARLQVDSRKWLLSKLAPKKYGDKLELGGDPANPLIFNITATDARL